MPRPENFVPYDWTDRVHILLGNDDDSDAHREADAEGYARVEALIFSLPLGTLRAIRDAG
jgi:hypothetical protein